MTRKQWLKTPAWSPPTKTGKDLTQPGLATNIKKAVAMLASDRLKLQAVGFYEEEGFPIPEFDKMDKIERLVAYNEYRELVETTTKKLQEMDDHNDKVAAKAQKEAEVAEIEKGIISRMENKSKNEG